MRYYQLKANLRTRRNQQKYLEFPTTHCFNMSNICTARPKLAPEIAPSKTYFKSVICCWLARCWLFVFVAYFVEHTFKKLTTSRTKLISFPLPIPDPPLFPVKSCLNIKEGFVSPAMSSKIRKRWEIWTSSFSSEKPSSQGCRCQAEEKLSDLSFGSCCCCLFGGILSKIRTFLLGWLLLKGFDLLLAFIQDSSDAQEKTVVGWNRINYCPIQQTKK